MGGDGRTATLLDCPEGTAGYARVSGGAREVAGPWEWMPSPRLAMAGVRAFSARALTRGMVALGLRKARGQATHHIVAGGAAAAAPARAVLERFGIGVDDAVNGLFLETGRHQRIHTGAYYAEVNSRLSGATSRSDVIEILGQIGGEIAEGVFPR